MTTFDSQVVAITGGSRGIGFAAARAFLENGAKVAICSRHKHSLGEAEKHLSSIGEIDIFHADIRIFDQANDFIEHAMLRFGKIDVLVNSAGKAWMGLFAQESIESIDEIIDTNLKGLLYTTRAVLPYMQERKSGLIINISSGLGKAGLLGFASYSATKFGVVGFTESLAQEVETDGIRVFAVCPGAVATDMQVEISGERVGMPPEHVAEKILLLAGPNPPIQSGECLDVYS